VGVGPGGLEEKRTPKGGFNNLNRRTETTLQKARGRCPFSRGHLDEGGPLFIQIITKSLERKTREKKRGGRERVSRIPTSGGVVGNSLGKGKHPKSERLEATKGLESAKRQR